MARVGLVAAGKMIELEIELKCSGSWMCGASLGLLSIDDSFPIETLHPKIDEFFSFVDSEVSDFMFSSAAATAIYGHKFASIPFICLSIHVYSFDTCKALQSAGKWSTCQKREHHRKSRDHHFHNSKQKQMEKKKNRAKPKKNIKWNVYKYLCSTQKTVREHVECMLKPAGRRMEKRKKWRETKNYYNILYEVDPHIGGSRRNA